MNESEPFYVPDPDMFGHNDAWSMYTGGATFDVGMRIERRVMTTRAQAGGVERDLSVLRTIARERDACLAIGALVTTPGDVRVGDLLTPA